MLEKLPERDYSVLGVGEVMLRLSPVGKERISQSETFDKMAGGSELNVVSGISQLGLRTGIITKLPANEIGSFIKNKIRYSGTSDDYITYDNGDNKRLGIYYYESGAYPRVSMVSYDRAGSSFTRFRRSELPPSVYKSTGIFHVSGITLGLGADLRSEVCGMMREFSGNGTLVSFDVNYRAALWDEATARDTVLSILPYVNILFVSEETLRRMLGRTGTLSEIHLSLAREYPGLKIIASTMRTATSPTRHDFTSFITDCSEKRHFSEQPYRDIEVVDRIGSGDAYVAGALYGLIRFGNIENAAFYGDAMSAVKNTIPGDMTVCSLEDIERVIRSHNNVGSHSEMVR